MAHDIPHLTIQSLTAAGNLPAIMIHPRRARQFREWTTSEGMHPTATFRAGETSFAVASVYLPHAGRDKKLSDAAVSDLHRILDEAGDVPTLFMGDYNTHCFPDELPLTGSGKWKGTQAVLQHDRTTQLQDFMAKGALSPITTLNEAETFIPDRPGGRARVLDCMLCPTRWCHVVRDTFNNWDTHMASDHSRLELVIEPNSRTAATEDPAKHHAGDAAPADNGRRGLQDCSVPSSTPRSGSPPTPSRRTWHAQVGQQLQAREVK